MNRTNRNQGYHIKSSGRLPPQIILRDITLTLVAWGMALYFCWDFILHLSDGILYAINNDPLKEMKWEIFTQQLKLSFLFSGSIFAFIGAWAVSNLLLLRRTQGQEGQNVPPLKLNKEVDAYGCTEDDVRRWRNEKIITVCIDDKGQILSVTPG